jgi:hypothetical protein
MMRSLLVHAPTATLVAGAVCVAALAALAGCGGGQDAAIETALDPQLADRSLARLVAVPPDGVVVLSILHGDGPAPDLSDQPARSLGFVPGIALVETTPASARVLAAQAPAGSVVIWGSGAHVARLEPSLRNLLLQTMTDPGWHDVRLEVIATFAPQAADPTADLRDAGAQIGSYAAGIATIRVTGETLLDVLAHDDLRAVSKPSLQRPTTGRR